MRETAAGLQATEFRHQPTLQCTRAGRARPGIWRRRAGLGTSLGLCRPAWAQVPGPASERAEIRGTIRRSCWIRRQWEHARAPACQGPKARPGPARGPEAQKPREAQQPREAERRVLHGSYGKFKETRQSMNRTARHPDARAGEVRTEESTQEIVSLIVSRNRSFQPNHRKSCSATTSCSAT